MKLFSTIDGLLRGQYTSAKSLEEGRVEIPLTTMAKGGIILGATYGAFMGLFSVLGENPSYSQLLATTIKVPLLFLLTLMVTFPSLYVFSALAQSRLKVHHTARLLLATVTVNLALLASFGPVTGFFTLSTDSYQFIQVLNVAFFAVSGLVGLVFLRKALGHVFVSKVIKPPPKSESGDESPAEPAPLTRSEASRSRTIFGIWMIIYAVVGAQMGWILRPFIGSPALEFSLFRERTSSFFEAFFKALGSLLS